MDVLSRKDGVVEGKVEVEVEVKLAVVVVAGTHTSGGFTGAQGSITH